MDPEIEKRYTKETNKISYDFINSVLFAFVLTCIVTVTFCYFNGIKINCLTRENENILAITGGMIFVTLSLFSAYYFSLKQKELMKVYGIEVKDIDYSDYIFTD